MTEEWVADERNLLTVEQALLIGGWWINSNGDANTYTATQSYSQIIANAAPRYYRESKYLNWFLPFSPGTVNPANVPGRYGSATQTTRVSLLRNTVYTLAFTRMQNIPGSNYGGGCYVDCYNSVTGVSYPPTTLAQSNSSAVPSVSRMFRTFRTPDIDNLFVCFVMQQSSGANDTVIADPVLFLGDYDPGPCPPRRPRPAPGVVPRTALPPAETSWAFLVVETTTGTIVGDLPISDFSGTVAIKGGSFTGSVALGGLDAAAQQRVLTWTTPARYSIALQRNDVVVGEWIIWSRSRDNSDVISVGGSELVSLLARRVTPAITFNGDSADVAAELLLRGFDGDATYGGAVQVEIEAPPNASGRHVDRSFTLGDGDIRSKIDELADDLLGFDYLVTSALRVTASGAAYSERLARLHCPRAGSERAIAFEVSALGEAPGNVVALSTEEDATKLASGVIVVGSKLVGSYIDVTLLNAGLPYLERAESLTVTPETQGQLDDYAESIAKTTQTAMIPQGVSVRADRAPYVGDYLLGDVVTLIVEPSPAYPTGYSAAARIVDWTFSPTSGAEVLALNVTQDGLGSIVPTVRTLSSETRALANRVDSTTRSLAARVAALEP